MQTVSQNFVSAVTSDNQVFASRIDVLINGVVQQGLDLQLVDGHVTYDRTRSIWRSCDVTFVNRSGNLVPASMADTLAPNGVELQLWRGIPGELVSLGVFVVEEPESLDSGKEMTIQVLGIDRTARVQWATFQDTFVIPMGTNAAAAIRWIISSGVPGLAYDLAPTAHETPLMTFDGGTSRWDAATGIAKDIGMEVCFGGFGEVRLRPVPNPATTPPVFSFVEGPTGTITTALRRMSRVGTFNVAIVHGENTSLTEPVRGVAKDLDPNSPTYIGGTFGEVVDEETRTGIFSTAMAQDAAQGKLLAGRNAFEEVDGEALPMSALEPSDIVAISKSRLRLAAEPLVLETATMPLRKGTMPLTLVKNPAAQITEL